MKSDPISAIPTNIITGFLGVGKTTAILHLLKSKPENERWAVLVNEFGEIGVDGSLFKGQQSEQNGIFVREVPGGCMCCAASLPMQIALNQLLAHSRPDRLLIEPTGLGHPLEVLDVLSATHYQDVLDIHRVVTLVDARKLKDKRYTEHETFQQQIQIADLLIANKADCYAEEDRSNLKSYAQQMGLKQEQLKLTVQGEFSFELLDKETQSSFSEPTGCAEHHHHESNPHSDSHSDSHSHLHEHSNDSDHNHSSPSLASEQELPPCGFLKAENQGEGFISQGWRFAPEIEFNRCQLYFWLNGLSVERVKAAFITTEGIFGYNLADEMLTEVELDECMESRIEIISSIEDEAWERELMACINKH